MTIDELAKPIIEALEMEEVLDAFEGLPFKAYKSGNLTLILTGNEERYEHNGRNVLSISYQTAGLATQLGIRKFGPDLIIDAGYARSMKAGIDVGDCVISGGELKFYDQRIPYKRKRDYTIGTQPTLQISGIAKELGLKEVNISTGSSYTISKKDLEKIEENKADVREKVAAGIAWEAKIAKINMISVKIITDVLGKAKLAHILAGKVIALVKTFDGITLLDELANISLPDILNV